MKRDFTESPLIKKHIPCEKCGSSDAKSIRADGSGYCFSCGTNFRTVEQTHIEDIEEMTSQAPANMFEIESFPTYPLTSRGISKEVVEHFGVKMSVDIDGRPDSHYYPYTKANNTVAYKVRKLPKSFSTVGDFKDLELFGQSNAVQGKTLVITEGELDAMAVAQAHFDKYKRFFAVVSLPNGAKSVQSILANRSWIRQFSDIILMFDMDDPGKEAVAVAAKMIGVGRVRVAKLQEKDPCDQLREHGSFSLLQAIWDAQTWSPAGILSGEQIWDKFLERKNVTSIPYPDCLGGLNEKLGGIRQGEITLFTSGTGSGKSTVIKEIVLDLLENTDEKIGLISLEESIGDTAEKFISMSMRRPLTGHPPLTEEELRVGFDNVFKDQRLVLLDHQGSVSDESLVDKIEYMALMGCKYLVLDHITIAVSEGSNGLSGNEAVDKLMSDLLKLVKQHNVWLGLISHLRKSQGVSFEEGVLPSIDDIKGSGSIKQISFDIIAFARNLVAEEDYIRNRIKLRVLKSRFTGKTGDAGCAVYDTNTTRLSAEAEGFEII